MQNQSGQTLIETLVAAFILIMGISAALGLATYSLGATTSIKQETVALGLAREGVEAVKNIRDTNWFKDTITSNCYDFLSGTQTAYCYRNWLNPGATGQNITAPGGVPRNATLRYEHTNASPWRIVATNTDFGLNLANVSSPSGFTGTYYNNVPGLTPVNGNSGFARAVILEEDSSFAPFNQTTGSRLKVTVKVWWSDKNCPMTNSIPTGNRCVVTLATYLTNWRNF